MVSIPLKKLVSVPKLRYCVGTQKISNNELKCPFNKLLESKKKVFSTH